MDEVKLLPCPNPWCEEQSPRWRMGISGRYTAFCGCGIETPWCDTKEQAIALWNTRPTLATDEVVERVAHEMYVAHAKYHGFPGERWDEEPATSLMSWRNTARAALAAMPAIPPQSLGESVGAIPGSHPADQAPSGLGASRIDPERG